MLRRIKRQLGNIRIDAESAGKAVPTVALDVFFSYFRYGSVPSDYHLFGFAGKSSAERETFVTGSYNRRLVKTLNNIDFRPIFEDKTLFAETFGQYFGRSFLVVRNGGVADFISNHPVFFAKKNYGYGGDGVKKMRVNTVSDPGQDAWASSGEGIPTRSESSDNASPDGFGEPDTKSGVSVSVPVGISHPDISGRPDSHQNNIEKPPGKTDAAGQPIQNPAGTSTGSAYSSVGDAATAVESGGYDLLEEIIVQHDGMSAICQSSVNTLRIATLLDGGKPHIPYAVLRCGRDREVDNMSSGGFACEIDVASGTVSTDGATRGDEKCESHPVSGIRFRGFEIPMWDECVSLVREAALVRPEVRYIGWDVAVTPGGPILVEGNYHPGYNVYQVPSGIGKKHFFTKYLP